MAKSKNHTSHNQNKKHHRNGIKRPKAIEYLHKRGVCQKFLLNLKFARKHNGVGRYNQNEDKIAEAKKNMKALKLTMKKKRREKRKENRAKRAEKQAQKTEPAAPAKKGKKQGGKK